MYSALAFADYLSLEIIYTLIWERARLDAVSSIHEASKSSRQGEAGHRNQKSGYDSYVGKMLAPVSVGYGNELVKAEEDHNSSHQDGGCRQQPVTQEWIEQEHGQNSASGSVMPAAKEIQQDFFRSDVAQ